MFKGWFPLSVLLCTSRFVLSSVEENNFKEDNPKESEEWHKVVDPYSSVFHSQNTGCFCKQNFCECCEDEFGEVCIAVAYYEVFDLPAAFGINITNHGKLFVSWTLNVTHLPCIPLPYAHSFKFCLQLHGFYMTENYVRVLFDMEVKNIATKLTVPLGCLLIPRLHPHINPNETVQYDNFLEKTNITKSPNDHTGIEFCSSSGFASGILPKNSTLNYYVVSLLFLAVFNISRT